MGTFAPITAFRLWAANHLRLDIEGLQPQAEVGPDAEEGLAHDDERRDVEDEVQGQIMKVQPIVEHETTDEWMKGNPSPRRKWWRKTTLS